MAVVIWLSSIWKYNYISRSNFFNRSPKKLMEGKEKREVEKGNEVAIFFLFWNSPRVQIHHLSPMLVPLILQHSGPKNCAQQKISFQNKKCFLKSWTPYCFIKKKTLQRYYSIFFWKIWTWLQFQGDNLMPNSFDILTDTALDNLKSEKCKNLWF